MFWNGSISRTGAAAAFRGLSAGMLHDMGASCGTGLGSGAGLRTGDTGAGGRCVEEAAESLESTEGDRTRRREGATGGCFSKGLRSTGANAGAAS